jgi:hypothetical protein
MGLKEKMDKVVELMKATKSDWVATKPENTDIAIYLHFYRGDDLIVAVQCPLDRDTALHAAHIGAMGFAAQTATISFESYHAVTEVSPLTGEPWLHQEMQYVAEVYPDRKDWVAECISVTGHDRDGAFGMWSQPYLIKDYQVEWGEETSFISSPDDEEPLEGAGRMFQAMQHAMTAPSIMEQIEKQIADDPAAAFISGLITDEEARLFHTDMATYRALEQRNLIISAVFAARDGSNRQQWLTERFGAQDITG